MSSCFQPFLILTADDSKLNPFLVMALTGRKLVHPDHASPRGSQYSVMVHVGAKYFSPNFQYENL